MTKKSPINVELGWPGAEVVIPGQRSRDGAHRQQRRKQLRRRSVIEALIGHMKNDGLLDRNWLKGKAGDAMHVVLCAAGQNLRLILRAIEAFFCALYSWLAGAATAVWSATAIVGSGFIPT